MNQCCKLGTTQHTIAIRVVFVKDIISGAFLALCSGHHLLDAIKVGAFLRGVILVQLTPPQDLTGLLHSSILRNNKWMGNNIA